MPRYDAIVIGAGINGLTAAAYLARAGRKVLVVERGEHIGGTACTEEFAPGFKANLCRDDPGWIPDRLVRDLRLRSHGLRVADAKVGLVAASGDAPPLITWPDVKRTAAALRASSPRDAEKWPQFCALVHHVAGLLERVYGTPPPRLPALPTGDLFPLLALGTRLRRLGRREMMEVLRAVPMPVADLVEECVEDRALAAALGTLGVRDVMHGPLSSGTALVLFHGQVGRARGAVSVRRIVQGGNQSLADALLAAARSAGAEVRTGASVTQIRVRDNAVTGVALDSGDEESARLIVSSLDPQASFRLVDSIWLDADLLNAVDNIRMRGATARVHFALDGEPPFASAGRPWDAETRTGTIVLAPSMLALELAYDEAKYGAAPQRPALTVTVPSASDSTFAPPGKHVVSIDIHHVPLDVTNGHAALGAMAQSRIEEIATGFGDRIVGRAVLTPCDLEARFGVTGGSLTHGELALDQMLFMRPVPQASRYATPLPGLWLCGTGTHPASPGGACGMLAAKRIIAQERD